MTTLDEYLGVTSTDGKRPSTAHSAFSFMSERSWGSKKSKSSGAKFNINADDVKEFDVNKDKIINLQEVRAGRMKRFENAQLEAWKMDRKKANAMYGHKRYSPFQQRCLDRLDRSKDVWGYSTVIKEDADLLSTKIGDGRGKIDTDEKREKTDKEMGYKTHYHDCFEAAVCGDAEAVATFVEKQGFKIYTHNERDGGNTLMHYAALYGHVDLLEYLISHVRSTDGEERLERFVNVADSVYSKMTPLIEACRNNIGYMNDRLKIIKILVEAGADVTLQDVSGDNCLHWAVRRSWLPVVRFVCYHTSAAVFASIADNFSSTKPIDIAANIIEKDRAAGKRLGHAPTEIFNILQELKKGCNIRLKIQCKKKKRIAEEGFFKTFINNETTRLEADIEQFMAQTNAVWDSQCGRAAKERDKLRKVVLQEAKQEGLNRAQKWLKTPDGRQTLKERTATLGGGKQARDRALRALVEAKEGELIKKATARFDRKNPSIKTVVEEELQEMQKHIDALEEAAMNEKKAKRKSRRR